MGSYVTLPNKSLIVFGHMKNFCTLLTLLTLCALSGVSVLHAQYAEKSVLAEGDIYSFSIASSGVYRLDKAFLESIEINTTLLDPQKIQLFGHPGGPLPLPNATDRVDDLAELPIEIVGGDDGRFDDSDYILFYGEGPWKETYLEEEERFHVEINPFSETSTFFIRAGVADGKRIEKLAEAGAGSLTITSYHDCQHHEVDRENLLHRPDNRNLQGSGQRWLGELFDGNREQSFEDQFDLRNIVDGTDAHLHFEFAARSSIASEVFINIGNQTFNKTITRTIVTDIEQAYAKFGVIKETFQVNEELGKISVRYPDKGNLNKGYLDFIELNLERSLIFGDKQLRFSNTNMFTGESATYEIEGLSSAQTVWEITDPLNPRVVSTDGNRFNHAGSSRARFVLASATSYMSPLAGGGKIENQNLHSLDEIEYLLIYHADFLAAAEKLATHRRSFSQLKVATVSIDQVFNEFSSGRVDPTALRDFTRMLYRKSSNLKYLILVGDGSFDYRNIYGEFGLNDESFIPVFETESSVHPITSFPTDDFYALLDEREGGNLRGALDIAVGRLTVRTSDEADLVVQKIVSYETEPEMLGDWRTRIMFVADDEDGARHLDAADAIAKRIRSELPFFNINKVYLDAFEQDNTPGGTFNIKATEALNNEMFRGQLVVNYIGHGGPTGWAQERVLQAKDIDLWNNGKKLPLLITATCSFTGYDNPQGHSAGELTLTNPNGGSVALFSTVRAVFAGSNERLTRSVFDHVFDFDGDKPLPIGEILVRAKNANSADTTGTNARKFTLIGDPAMRLAIPNLQVQTLSINGKSGSELGRDTIKALSRVTVTGEILDAGGSVASTYNGEIFPTIFDKSTQLKTLAQDDSPERTFDLQKSVIFKGRAKVSNGQFSFTFVVPKDINYAVGNGKISYYAENGTVLDAKGSYDQFILGGTNEASLNDQEGPEINIYLNDDSFVAGGVTDANPTLFINLKDENGINVTGNSIGHDLTAVLDGDRQNSLVLNDFYEASLDDFTSGLVTFPFSDLEEGPHTIDIKAWDVANNSSEMRVEFVVADGESEALRRIYNYPNPFNDNTCFQFEHNFVNQDIDIRVEVYTVKGQLVKTIQKSVKPSGALSRDLKWDGRDEFGDPLASGIYVYRVKVNNIDRSGVFQTTHSDLQKLVILR